MAKIKNKKKHLSDEERFCIEKMLNWEEFGGYCTTLGRGKSTISEEVKANGGRKKYKAEAAIQRAYLKQYRKKRNCNKVALDGHLTKFMEKKIGSWLVTREHIFQIEIQSGLPYASSKEYPKIHQRKIWIGTISFLEKKQSQRWKEERKQNISHRP